MTVLPRQLVADCGCDDASLTPGLISIDKALQKIARHVAPVTQTQKAPIHTCRGRVLASAVLARADMPRFDHAAMDGYAINHAALAGDGPWDLPVQGRVAAGDPRATVFAATSACRIFTGAPVPYPFDCVVMRERVERLGDMIRISKKPCIGENIRNRGEEHRLGAEIVPQGAVLTPRAIAACVAAGHGTVDIQARVRVTLLATGSEIAAAGTTDLSTGQIWDVNTPMLQALLARPDVVVNDIIRIEDNAHSIRNAIQAAAKDSDLIVTTGGVSVGDEDHLRKAVGAAGGTHIFAGVGIKPGKPVALGKVGNAVWLGLPGNPGSAFVTWSVFGHPVLNRLSGRAEEHLARRTAVLGHDVRSKAGRCEIRAARVVGTYGYGRDVVACSSTSNSGQICHFASSDGFAFLPSELDHLPEGAVVAFLPFALSEI